MKNQSITQGLIKESVLTNKLMQRVMYAIQTENLDELPSETLRLWVEGFKGMQANLNKTIDVLCYSRALSIQTAETRVEPKPKGEEGG